MKIYIVGSVASGKSTLARQISKNTNISCTHLDEVVYVEDSSNSWGNRKRPTEERDMIFHKILEQKDYIIEDAGRECFIEGMAQSDIIILLEIPIAVRYKRILLRWIKQNIGIEKCIYKPNINMLKSMFKWARNYDTGIDGTKALIAKYKNKVTVLHNNREIKSFLNLLSKQYK